MYLKKFNLLTGLSLVGATALLSACGNSVTVTTSGSSAIPLVTPPVEAATPASLSTASLRALHKLFPTSVRPQSVGLIATLKDRFYPTEGPTKISRMLGDIDTLLTGINTRSTAGTHACLSATPVSVAIDVFGDSITNYFQCYDASGTSSGLLFGKKDDTWYVYSIGGQERVLAQVTLVSGTTDKYEVEAWLSIGELNAADASTCHSHWYGCSYGGIHLKANSATSTLEVSAAGTGLGFCSSHLRSDGTNLYLSGEQSGGTTDGTSWSCASDTHTCVVTSNLTDAGTCTGLDTASTGFTVLGVHGESAVATNVTLDGTAADDVHFGPSAAVLNTYVGVDAF